MANDKMSVCGDTHLSVWHQAASTEDVERLWREADALIEQATGNICLLLIVQKGTKLSPAPARSTAVAMVREQGERIAAIAVVIEGDGIRPVSLRAMFTSLGLILRPGFPWQMFATVDTATEWLASSHSGCSAAQLRLAVDALHVSS